MRSLINYTGDGPTWRSTARGGGAGKGGGGNSTTTSQTTYSPEEEARRQSVFSAGQGLYDAMAPTSGDYRGPAPVGFDPATIASQALTYGNTNQAQSIVPNAATAANFALTSGRDVNTNPYMQEAIKAAIRPQTQAFTESTLPALRMGTMAGGVAGGSRPNLNQGIAAGRLGDSIASTAATMANAGYNTGQQAATDTLRSMPQIMQGISSPASMLSQVGAQRENLAQEAENYNASQRISAVNGPWELLNSWSGLLSNMSNPITQTNSTMPRQGVSPIQGLGALGSAAGLAGKFL